MLWCAILFMFVLCMHNLPPTYIWGICTSLYHGLEGSFLSNSHPCRLNSIDQHFPFCCLYPLLLPCCLYLSFTYERYHSLFFFLLTEFLSMRSCCSICNLASCMGCPLLELYSIPFSMNTTKFWSIYLYMGIWFLSISWLRRTVMNIGMCISSRNNVSVFGS